MRITNYARLLLPAFVGFLLLSTNLPAQNPPPDPNSVPVVDGGAGSCSADFTVTDSNQSPVYNAKIRVHIAYGFMYARKLDLEVSTNVNGKARFTGIPQRTKQGLFFQASEGEREGSAFVDPDKTCSATMAITLMRKLK